MCSPIENAGTVQTFGEYLREQREAKGFSLRQFAQMVRVAPSYVSNIESGATPPPAEKIISRMAQALGLREGALLARAGKVRAGTLRWFWSQPLTQELLGCASGMTESDARMYVLTAFPELAGYQGEQTA